MSMMLAKPEILKKIKSKQIRIDPFVEKNVGPISIDLTLEGLFGVQKKGTLKLTDDFDYRKHFTQIKAKQYVLKPGEFILGMTREKITLPNNIAGLLDGRSRFARAGLIIHATAHLVHPGVSNRQIFEIKNIGKSPLILTEGLKMGQICFFELKGKAQYSGMFKKQSAISW